MQRDISMHGLFLLYIYVLKRSIKTMNMFLLCFNIDFMYLMCIMILKHN